MHIAVQSMIGEILVELPVGFSDLSHSGIDNMMWGIARMTRDIEIGTRTGIVCHRGSSPWPNDHCCLLCGSQRWLEH